MSSVACGRIGDRIRVASRITIQPYTVYDYTPPAGTADQWAASKVATPAVRTMRRRHYGRAVGLTSSLSRYARSWESTWEPCSGSPEESEGAFFYGCRDSSVRR